MVPTMCGTAVDRPLLVHHVARQLNVSRRTVRWWARAGRLKAFRLRVKVWAFRREDVASFAAARSRAKAA
jgi:excisionase family DNA binding protein